MILTSDERSAAQRVRARARQIHPGIVTPVHLPLRELLDVLPVLSKEKLADHLPPDDEWLETAVLLSETSGTTARPLQTPRGSTDLAWNANNQATAYRRFLQPGIDRVAILHPSILSPFIEATSIALRSLCIGQLRIYPIPHVCDYRRIYDIMNRYKITTVMSTPSLVYKMFYEFTKFNNDINPRLLKNILLTGEHLSTASIQNLQKIVGSDAFVAPFVYGSSEAATLMIGRADGCYDPILDDFVFELHDSEIEDEKKLVVTWLRDGLMPIVRYDTGDYFSIESRELSILRFIGRHNSNSNERKLRMNVEQAIYSLKKPVFHYHGYFSEEKQLIDISIVSMPDSKLANDLKQKILRHFPSWNISVQLNPHCIDFLKFSPYPKTPKLEKYTDNSGT